MGRKPRVDRSSLLVCERRRGHTPIRPASSLGWKTWYE
jgi:hypothetical protein